MTSENGGATVSEAASAEPLDAFEVEHASIDPKAATKRMRTTQGYHGPIA